MSNNIIAIFDFDGTITTRDSLLPFLSYLVGIKMFYLGLLRISPTLIAYAFNLISNSKAKEVLLTQFIRGQSYTQIEQICQNFVREKIPQLIREEAIQRLQWHKVQGHQTVLLSASLEIYLIPWAKAMGFDAVIATKLEIEQGLFTGRFHGKNCHGEEKVNRIQEFLGDLSQYCLYAYGDSYGDRALLKQATFSYYRIFDTVNNLN